MTEKEIVLLLENLPLAVPAGMTQSEVALMMAGHRQARDVAIALVLGAIGSAPLVIEA